MHQSFIAHDDNPAIPAFDSIGCDRDDCDDYGLCQKCGNLQLIRCNSLRLARDRKRINKINLRQVNLISLKNLLDPIFYGGHKDAAVAIFDAFLHGMYRDAE